MAYVKCMGGMPMTFRSQKIRKTNLPLGAFSSASAETLIGANIIRLQLADNAGSWVLHQNGRHRNAQAYPQRQPCDRDGWLVRQLVSAELFCRQVHARPRLPRDSRQPF